MGQLPRVLLMRMATKRPPLDVIFPVPDVIGPMLGHIPPALHHDHAAIIAASHSIGTGE